MVGGRKRTGAVWTELVVETRWARAATASDNLFLAELSQRIHHPFTRRAQQHTSCTRYPLAPVKENQAGKKQSVWYCRVEHAAVRPTRVYVQSLYCSTTRQQRHDQCLESFSASAMKFLMLFILVSCRQSVQYAVSSREHVQLLLLPAERTSRHAGQHHGHPLNVARARTLSWHQS